MIKLLFKKKKQNQNNVDFILPTVPPELNTNNILVDWNTPENKFFWEQQTQTKEQIIELSTLNKEIFNNITQLQNEQKNKKIYNNPDLSNLSKLLQQSAKKIDTITTLIEKYDNSIYQSIIKNFTPKQNKKTK